ncbi:hypothetical protein D9758_005870 [Tetrapyrgos nigripes]|uniref:NF-kappa-B-activating protein C-terminal domain-containing protein n=1 Tax=Tetrapyrgos nigripes TaxID=182062 RepID=A0A8H5G2U4_9AGAR|nr:hypothetical protein D9758_005870 [Tetrapyrgos nigripes]
MQTIWDQCSFPGNPCYARRERVARDPSSFFPSIFSVCNSAVEPTMATVHPSRMALVPQDSSFSSHNRSKNNRSPSPRRSRRSPTPTRSRNDRDGDRDHGRSDYRDRDRERERDRYRDESRDYDRRRDSRRDRDSSSGKHDTNERDTNRRGSPEYDDYRRTERSEDSGVPGRRPENMYPDRRGREPERDAPPHNDGYSGNYRGRRGGGEVGTDFLDSRRIQRESATVDIWPPSPKGPTRSLSPPRHHRSSKKSKRHRSESPSDTDSSEEERRRRERKERKRRKTKEKEEKREKKRSQHRTRSRDRSYDDDSEDERERRHSKRSRTTTRSPERKRSPSRTRSPLPNEEDEDEWVIKSSSAADSMPPPPVPAYAQAKDERSSYDQDDSDDELGPQPVVKINSSKRIDERAYGGQLLRGEGSAMAAFLQDGTESRIPRRGEIGLTSDQIAEYENVGYVMSGSRHRRMNAVRMRKENQVISAEEKRGILKLQKEERARREAILREEFSELVQDSLKAQGAERPPKP